MEANVPIKWLPQFLKILRDKLRAGSQPVKWKGPSNQEAEKEPHTATEALAKSLTREKMLDSCSNNKEKQVMWIEKETQVTGATPEQNCFDQNIIAPEACLVCWPVPKHLCQISACVVHTPGFLSHPYLCYTHPQPELQQFTWKCCAGHRRHAAVSARSASQEPEDLHSTKPTSRLAGNIGNIFRSI